MRFKIDWASLIVAGKCTVFALFHFVFEGNFSSTNLRGAYIWRGNLTEGFLRSRFGGLIYMEGFIFGILRYANESHNCTNLVFVMSSLLFLKSNCRWLNSLAEFFRLFFRYCTSRVFNFKDPLCSYFFSSLLCVRSNVAICLDSRVPGPISSF